jgi:DNA-binding MarR family transcriptional regulator
VAGGPDGFDPIAEARRQWEAHDWVAAAPGMAAITSVTRAHQIFLARIDDCLGPFELTFARYELLRLLAFSRKGSLPLGKIGDRLQVHATSVTSAVNRLESQGFVRRDPHPTDGRTTLATITRTGRSTVERATRALNEHVFETTGLSARDTQTLFDLLGKVRRTAGDY